MSQSLEQIFMTLGIAQESIEQARQRQTTHGGSLRENLIALNIVTEETFSKSVKNSLRVSYINPKDMPIADNVLTLLPREKAEKYFALPLELDSRHRRLKITMADPSDMSTIDELKFIVGHTLIPHYTPEDELIDAIQREYSRFEESQAIAAAWRTQTQPTVSAEVQCPVIDVAALVTGETAIGQLIGAIFTMAHSKHATEIHLAPDMNGILLSMRIDGKVAEIARFPRRLTTPLLTRIQRILGCDVSERTCFVQRGSAVVKFRDTTEFDASYQIYPTLHSENILVKLKDRHTLPTVNDFALAPGPLGNLQRSLMASHGIVLAAGTAKSGLTTTLYAFLNMLNKPEWHLLSIENPIEATLEGVAQGQIQEESGHTYARYLQYAFGQRPDVIMIDNVFDAMVTQQLGRLASGALVLSSLPAVDTASAAIKLMLMTSPEFVATHVNCITAQRLVRRLCESCKEEVTLPAPHREKLGFAPEDRCYTGKGCEECGHNGYKGVVPIYEVMLFTEAVKHAIMESVDVNALRTLNANNNIVSLRDDGMRKIKQGVTTVQEVLKATMI
jgi:type IV pilus assembly protein PilB